MTFLSRKRKRDPGSFTVLIVPHTEHAPVSLRVPVWIVYLILSAALVFGAYLWQVRLELRAAEEQLAYMRREQQVAVNRQIDLRATIYGQQQQLQNLESEVARLSEGVSQMDRLMGEIRKIVGLERQTPAPTSTTIVSRQWGEVSEEPVDVGPAAPDTGERASGGVSGSGTFGQAVQLTVNQLLAQTPARLEELTTLQEVVTGRVAQIDRSRWSNPAPIEQQLKIWDAAPKAWPVYGPITSRFGYRVIFGASDFHEGVDIGATWGTPVRAPADGIVTFAGWKGTYGWAVELAHDMGFATLYGHLSVYNVEVGDRVKAGTVIGHVGNTGKSTGPHLHYEIMFYGTAVDPLKYLGQ